MSVFSLLEKLSYADHGSLIKQSVVSREKKEYRRALQLLANPTTAYHATSADPLPDILSSGELKPGRWRNAYGKGVYFGIGVPAGDYYPTSGAMFATTNPLKNTVPLVTQHLGVDNLKVGVKLPKNRTYYWTNTPDAVPISNNKTTFILPAEGDYSDSVRANKLRSISRNNFRRAFEATHPSFSDWMFYHQASENPAGTNRVIGERVFNSLKDAEAIAKSMGGLPPVAQSETLAPLLGDVTAAKPSAPTQALLSAAGDAAGPTGPTQALLGEVPAAKPSALTQALLEKVPAANPSAPTQALLGEVPAAKPSAQTQSLLEAAGVAAKPSAPAPAPAPATVLDNMKWYRSRNLLGGALAGTAIGGVGLAAHLINRKNRNAYATNQLAG